MAGHKNPLQTLTLNYQGGIVSREGGREEGTDPTSPHVYALWQVRRRAGRETHGKISLHLFAFHHNGLSLLFRIRSSPQGKQQQGRLWTDEEDIFLLILMHKFEYGNWERIRMEIRKVRCFAASPFPSLFASF